MSSPTTPTRVDSALVEAAQVVGRVLQRNTGQQISHWARVGRAVEESATASPGEIRRVLAGEVSYDTLGANEQAIVRTTWQEVVETRRVSLNYEEMFTRAGMAYAELDENGQVVTRGVTPS